jgi:serine/threonine protein kinase/Tol biopolymer transport system component
MTLTAGTKLGPYEIVAPIGAGGMGEVYRARDPRIGRDVAVKVLPAAFSKDPERLRRFEQESRSAGVLNHPNILAIFDVGSYDGAPYVVSELLEGETLRERVKAGALPPRKAIEIGVQIAQGLATAHEHGIVHRDLKPENVFVTRDGRVKILDFGLAKLTLPERDARTSAPTVPHDTGPGTVWGTASYMSPEQVRGNPVDHRSDIFSFGTILYEMLTGERPFRGATSADTTSAILKDDPPDLTGIGTTPPALDRLVHHCLEKNPGERFQSARDLAFNLEAISGLSGTKPAQAAPRKRAIPGWIPMGAASLLLVAGAILLLPRILGPRDAKPVMRLPLDVPAGLRLAFNSKPEISPDGSMVVFVASDSSGTETLWLRRLDSLTPRKLPGTAGGVDPFWSPDGRSIAFFADAKLKRLSVTGGPIQVLCDAGSPRGGTWGRNDVIVFAPGASGGLFRVDAGGGNPEPVTVPDSSRGETAHRYPYFLPDGEHFLFLAVPDRNGLHDIYAGSIRSTRRKPVLRATGAPRYAAPGYLLYCRGDLLTGQRFDAGRIEAKGDAVTISETPSTSNIVGFPIASVSNAGVLAYRLEAIANTELGWYNGRGELLSRLSIPPGQFTGPQLSPDGTRIIMTAREGSGSDIWMIEVRTGAATRLTSDPGSEEAPEWSPDGTRIVYSSDRLGGSALFVKSLRGGEDELLYRSPKPWISVWDWSQDGRYVVYREIDTVTGFDLWILPMFGERKPFPYLKTRFEEQSAAFAPGGHWMAYSSDESGRREVYVQRFPTPGDRHRISADGGIFPIWSADGKTLFYLHPSGRVMSVAIRADSANLDVGAPRTLFTWPTEKLVRIRGADVAPDGRFLIALQSSEGPSAIPVLILNWPELMKRKE